MQHFILSPKRLLSFFIIFTVGLILNCADSEKSTERLEFPGDFPTSLKVGESKGPTAMTLFSRDSRGRLVETKSYTNFELTSDDTTLIRIVESRTLVGVKSGKTTVSAKSNGGKNILSGKQEINVLP